MYGFIEVIIMAIVTTRNCITCHESFAAVNEQRECNNCKNAAKIALREKHFDELDNMTLEERLRRVEEWIYDYQAPISPWDMKF